MFRDESHSVIISRKGNVEYMDGALTNFTVEIFPTSHFISISIWDHHRAATILWIKVKFYLDKYGIYVNKRLFYH